MDNLNNYIVERIRIDNVKPYELDNGKFFKLPFDVDWTIITGGNKMKLPETDWYAGVIEGEYDKLVLWNKRSSWVAYISTIMFKSRPPHGWWKFFHDEKHKTSSPESFFELLKKHFSELPGAREPFGVGYIDIDKNTEALINEFKNKFGK